MGEVAREWERTQGFIDSRVRNFFEFSKTKETPGGFFFSLSKFLHAEEFFVIHIVITVVVIMFIRIILRIIRIHIIYICSF